MLALRFLRGGREKKRRKRRNDWRTSRKRGNESCRGIRKEKPNELRRKQKHRERGRREIASMKPCMVVSTRRSLLNSHTSFLQQMPQREEPP
jgi:hypothetical protein